MNIEFDSLIENANIDIRKCELALNALFEEHFSVSDKSPHYAKQVLFTHHNAEVWTMILKDCMNHVHEHIFKMRRLFDAEHETEKQKQNEGNVSC